VIRRKPLKPEYATWVAIQKRGPICRRWRCYVNFRKDVGKKPSWTHLVVRDDTSRAFEPGNARWQVAKSYRTRPRGHRDATIR
jgi:hypothetical protein